MALRMFQTRSGEPSLWTEEPIGRALQVGMHIRLQCLSPRSNVQQVLLHSNFGLTNVPRVVAHLQIPHLNVSQVVGAMNAHAL